MHACVHECACDQCNTTRHYLTRNLYNFHVSLGGRVRVVSAHVGTILLYKRVQNVQSCSSYNPTFILSVGFLQSRWPIGFLKCYAGQSFIIALSCGVLTVTAYEPVAAPLSASAHKSWTVSFKVAGRLMSNHFNVCASEAEPVLITVTTVQFFESGPAQTNGFAGCEPPEQRPTQRP